MVNYGTLGHERPDVSVIYIAVGTLHCIFIIFSTTKQRRQYINYQKIIRKI